MVSATRHLDQLPTTPLRALKRQAPPPLPPLPLPRSLPPHASPIPSSVARVLPNGRLTFELPIAELSEQEIAEIMAWLGGRASNVHVRRNLHARGIDRVVNLARSVRAGVRAAVHAGLLWTLARLGDADQRASRLSPP